METPHKIQNAIEEAVYGAFGSVRRCAVALDIATQSVYEHLGRGHIRTRDTALRFEEATRMAGHPIPAAELMAIVPWQGPTRLGDGPKNGRKRPQERRTRRLAPVPSPARSVEPAGAQAQQRASSTRAQGRDRGRSRPSWLRVSTAVGF